MAKPSEAALDMSVRDLLDFLAQREVAFPDSNQFLVLDSEGWGYLGYETHGGVQKSTDPVNKVQILDTAYRDTRDP